VSNTMLVDVSSRIDVSGQGYPLGRTSGNTTTNASTCHSGGTYGGLGGAGQQYNGCSGSAGYVYGDFADPSNWGGGSGGGGAGGGGWVAGVFNDMRGSTGQIGAKGGGGTTNTCCVGQNGGAGTVYLKKNSDAFGSLIVDNGGTLTSGWSTPLQSQGALRLL